uniref:ST8 alpha-N-acetyl-neuraminide alpha-2,8-sialyltransferase 1 n=1 Tax=Equus caballus TaxID=9796 RepID=A0A9L0R0V6_HORSE
MSPCGRARRHTSRGAMAVLAWKFPRTRLPVGASALCVVVLCWLYIFPVYRLPNEKEIVQGVLQQGTAWRRNQTAARVFRYSCPRGSFPLLSFPRVPLRTGSLARTTSQNHPFHPVFLVLLPFFSIPNWRLVRDSSPAPYP